MTPHPTRLAVLISLMGVSLSASSNELVAKHESARAEVARVVHALRLDAEEHAAAVSHAPRRPDGHVDEQTALPERNPTSSNATRVEATDAPSGPEPWPNAPVDPDVLLGLAVRPADEPERVARLEGVAADDPPDAPASQSDSAPSWADAVEGAGDDVSIADPAQALLVDGSDRTDASPTPRVRDDPAELRGRRDTASEATERPHAPWDRDTLAMDASRLDGVRGGFVTDSGLKLSFGIERAVYINGTLVTTTTLNVSELSQLSAGQAAARLNGGTLAVVQSGRGNTLVPGAVSASTFGTLIQNTLDNQNIQSVTTINATVNSGEVIRSMNLQQSIQHAITAIRR